MAARTLTVLTPYQAEAFRKLAAAVRAVEKTEDATVEALGMT